MGSTFSIFNNFHDIEINLQNELVDICSAFVALKNRIFVRDLCTLIAQGLPCRAFGRQHTCIFFEYMSRYMFAASGQAQMTEFSWFCKKMLPAPGGEHYFPLRPSLSDNPKLPPEAWLALMLLPCGSISRPKICFWLQCRAYFHFWVWKSLNIVFLFPYFPNIPNQAWLFHENFKNFLNFASCPRCGA